MMRHSRFSIAKASDNIAYAIVTMLLDPLSSHSN